MWVLVNFKILNSALKFQILIIVTFDNKSSTDFILIYYQIKYLSYISQDKSVWSKERAFADASKDYKNRTEQNSRTGTSAPVDGPRA